MRVVYTEKAEAQLARALAFGIDHHGEEVAERTYHRLIGYIEDFLVPISTHGNLSAKNRGYCIMRTQLSGTLAS